MWTKNTLSVWGQDVTLWRLPKAGARSPAVHLNKGLLYLSRYKVGVLLYHKPVREGTTTLMTLRCVCLPECSGRHAKSLQTAKDQTSIIMQSIIKLSICEHIFLSINDNPHVNPTIIKFYNNQFNKSTRKIKKYLPLSWFFHTVFLTLTCLRSCSL